MVFGPVDVGGQKVGHFGFFRARFQDTLWPPVLEWLLNSK
jgi:predicted alpha/beta hydrolase